MQPTSTVAAARHAAYRFSEITDRAEWNRLVDGVPGSFFTQLWEWGELRRMLGWEPHRLVFTDASQADDGDILLQLVVRRLPVVRWGIAHAPRGPVVRREAAVTSVLVPALESWARQHRVATVVIDPDVPPGSALARALDCAPWRMAAPLGENRVHILDLDPSTDPWANVRRKHREWVRKAEKAGVDVAWSDVHTSPSDADEAMRQFEAVYGELVERLNLSTHGPRFMRGVWDLFRAGGRAQLGTATLRGVPVAAMLHVTTADQMVWYAGGQAEAGSSVGAGKLLLWRSIVRAQELGFRRYHMWGTATDSLAHYKEGFGAREERYIGSRSLAPQPVRDVAVRAAWSVQRLAAGLRHRLADRRGRRAPGLRP
jgi:peptidoglycan pentaglycine glycine transferase (the first glycine)